MDSTDEGNWALLEQYVAGELLPGDTVRIERWLATDRELRSYVTLMRNARHRTNRTGHGWDASAAFGRALAQRTSHTCLSASTLPLARKERITTTPTRSFRTTFVPAFIAVALLVAIALRVSIYIPLQHQPGNITSTIYTTRNAQRATIVLTDGTEVILNVTSRMEVTRQNDSRTVTLDGGAFFRVIHNTTRPFTVNARGTKTRVLGTAFSVLSYNTEPVTVAVQTGRVAVNNAILNAHEVAYVNGSQSPRIVREQNIEPWTGFTNGRLVLDKLSLDQAIPALNRWYDVDIRLADVRLETYPINAVLLSGSVSELLEILRVTFDVIVVRDGRTITLYPR